MHGLARSFYLEKYHNLKSMELRSSRRSRSVVGDPSQSHVNVRARNDSMFIMYIV